MNPATHNPAHEAGEDDETICLEIPADRGGARADQALSTLLDDVSRSTIQQWIQQGRVTRDGQRLTQRQKVAAGDVLQLIVPPPEDTLTWAPQVMDINVVYEDSDVRVVNKPADLVVHPGAGHHTGTLVNGLLAMDADLATLPRAGIVHRLDKDTSGLLVCARTEAARLSLIEQLSTRSLHREYFCVVHGTLIGGGVVDKPVGRSRSDRTRMAVTSAGKRAITHYRIERRYRQATALAVTLETGRTHQIRVHMRALGHPIVGDPAYGGARRLGVTGASTDSAASDELKRQALHARKLGFRHPRTNEPMRFECSLPSDLTRLVELLEADIEPAGSR